MKIKYNSTEQYNDAYSNHDAVKACSSPGRPGLVAAARILMSVTATNRPRSRSRIVRSVSNCLISSTFDWQSGQPANTITTNNTPLSLPLTLDKPKKFKVFK